MRIAITGGTGFVGRHLAARLRAEGHEVVAFGRGTELESAFAGCDAVAHCAGINREIGEQTYARVHVAGTSAVVEAARRAGVGKIVMMSFLRARPGCGSPYHESKWAAEEIVRASGLDYTIVKAGMTYGRGDHMLDHLSHSLFTLPFFLAVGFREQAIRPLAVDDLVRVLKAALVEGRLSRETVAAVGPETLTLSEAARRVAQAIGRRVVIAPAPVWFHRLLAYAFEWTMRVPLVAKAQVRILSEPAEPLPFASDLPPDLAPRLPFTDDQIARGLPEPGRFTLRDLRCCYATTPR